MMPYKQNIDRCLAEAVGPAGLSPAELADALDRTEPALTQIRARHADGSLPLLRLPAEAGDLPLLRDVASRFRDRFSHVVVLGTGGSSLGGQTLCALSDRGFGPAAGAPTLHFMDNIDPDTFQCLFDRLDPKTVGFIAVSKSGGTTETLTQLLICHDWVRAAVGETATSGHFVAITEPRDNVLRQWATQTGVEILDHDPGVGGRFSVLSLVGLLPALIAGLDAAAIRDGAAAVLTPILSGDSRDEIAPAVGAAVSVSLCDLRGLKTTVLMPYIDRLAHFGLWYRQLWAESLGKGGMGTTPIRALGTVDQHSQLQLYVDGPADKMFTVMTLACAGQGECVDPKTAKALGLDYLAAQTLGDVMDAEQRATIETLARNGRPTRVIGLDDLDERTMGALLMHFMLETIIAADMFGVDAYDQPAVEQGKVLTRQYLDARGGRNKG